MLIIVNGEYINPIAIARIADTNEGSMILLTNGERISTDRSSDDITVETGAVVGANAGFEAAWSSDCKVEREAIIAWRIYGIEDPAVPMVVSGRPNAHAIIFPCGKVFDRDAERFHADLGTWTAAMFEEQERKAKAAAVADV
jgi:hypothetical protein